VEGAEEVTREMAVNIEQSAARPHRTTPKAADCGSRGAAKPGLAHIRVKYFLLSERCSNKAIFFILNILI